MSSSHISSVQKKFLPVATATKSETTATLQSSNKFMSWMIPNKRIPSDQITDTASISSKKSSSSTKDELLSKKLDIDVNKLFDYATKELHSFGYPPSTWTMTLENNTNKVGVVNSTIAVTATISTTPTVITNGGGSSVSSTAVISSSTTSTSLSLDASTNVTQKMKVTEIFDKPSSIPKPVEKERYIYIYIEEKLLHKKLNDQMDASKSKVPTSVLPWKTRWKPFPEDKK